MWRRLSLVILLAFSVKLLLPALAFSVVKITPVRAEEESQQTSIGDFWDLLQSEGAVPQEATSVEASTEATEPEFIQLDEKKITDKISVTAGTETMLDTKALGDQSQVEESKATTDTGQELGNTTDTVLNTKDLAIGDHNVILEVKTEDGQEDLRQITIEVLPPPPAFDEATMDRKAPELVDFVFDTLSQATATFSEELDIGTAENISNYQIQDSNTLSPAEQTNLTIGSAVYDPITKSVVFSVAGLDNNANNEEFRIEVKNVTDIYGNNIFEPIGITSNLGGILDKEPPTLLGANIDTLNQITITFSEALSQQEAEKIENYKAVDTNNMNLSVSDNIMVSSAIYDSSINTVTLSISSLNEQKGEQINIFALNVTDRAGNVTAQQNYLATLEIGSLPIIEVPASTEATSNIEETSLQIATAGIDTLNQITVYANIGGSDLLQPENYQIADSNQIDQAVTDQINIVGVVAGATANEAVLSINGMTEQPGEIYQLTFLGQVVNMTQENVVIVPIGENVGQKEAATESTTEKAEAFLQSEQEVINEEEDTEDMKDIEDEDDKEKTEAEETVVQPENPEGENSATNNEAA